jgi:TonB family protein
MTAELVIGRYFYMNPENDQSPRFVSIDPGRQHWARWGASLFIHCLCIALLLAVSTSTSAVQVRRIADSFSISDPAPQLRYKPPKPLRRQQVNIPPRPPSPVKLPEPAPVKIVRIEPLPAKIQQHAPQTPNLETPRLEPPVIVASKQPVPVADLPPLRSSPQVHTGAFGSAAEVSPELLAMNTLRREVSTGGFSDGAVNAIGSRRAAPIQAGGFDQASAGSGTGKQFGRGGGAGNGGVGKGGFDLPVAAEVSHRAGPGAPANPATSPVEITFKPRPVYTDEARAQGIEGEVLLEVRFCSTGRIQVLRVVRGLGHGLDQSARVAAEQIRFRPGLRDGAPVDTQGIIHIVFQLS